jgi:hypothetical protein
MLLLIFSAMRIFIFIFIGEMKLCLKLQTQGSKQILLKESSFPFVDIAVRTSDPFVYTFLTNENKKSISLQRHQNET